MAEDVAARPPARPAAERPAAERPATNRAERARSSAYYTRFSLAYMLLIMLAVGGVGALVLILIHPGAKQGPPWSAFKPTGTAVQVERQIATKVSSEYKATSTRKLVSVLPGPLATTRYLQTSAGQTSVQVPISLVAVEPDISTGKHKATDYTFFHPSSTVAYEMCGFGSSQQNCSVASEIGANPTGVLHREALELALYTLKYVPGTAAVIVYLPPPANPQTPATALLFPQSSLKPNLHLPLARTLEPQQVILGGGVPNANHVGELTASHVYSSDYQTLPGDGKAVLVLTPVG
ncbi:MAG TPA: hypothetical protein VJ814_10405 [Gaiellaceae bacterium]|nr:hypothetical protein [Gaiellaceae bacterium]